MRKPKSRDKALLFIFFQPSMRWSTISSSSYSEASFFLLLFPPVAAAVLEASPVLLPADEVENFLLRHVLHPRRAALASALTVWRGFWPVAGLPSPLFPGVP